MAKRTEEQVEKLDNVTRTRRKNAAARQEILKRYETLIRAEIAALDAEDDLAVREAYDADCKISWIQEAYPTRDFYTIQRILDRTPSLGEFRAEAEAAERYELRDPDELAVHYRNYGPEKISGDANFQIVKLDDAVMLYSIEVDSGNDVIRVLDGRLDGFYYDDALNWVKKQ